jgi:hypothetical protein
MKLKKCPMCHGNPALEAVDLPMRRRFWVQCACGLSGRFCLTEDEAKRFWNERGKKDAVLG